MKKIEKDFRQAVKNAIERKKVSMAKVAREAGLNHQTLYNYLQGKSDMGTDNLTKVMNVLERM